MNKKGLVLSSAIALTVMTGSAQGIGFFDNIGKAVESAASSVKEGVGSAVDSVGNAVQSKDDSGDSGNTEAQGTGVGAVVGAGLGYYLGGREGAVIGAALGGLTGNLTAKHLDKRRQEYANKDDALKGEIGWYRSAHQMALNANEALKDEIEMIKMEIEKTWANYGDGEKTRAILAGQQQRLDAAQKEADDKMKQAVAAMQKKQSSVKLLSDTYKLEQAKLDSFNKEVDTIATAVEELNVQVVAMHESDVNEMLRQHRES